MYDDGNYRGGRCFGGAKNWHCFLFCCMQCGYSSCIGLYYGAAVVQLMILHNVPVLLFDEQRDLGGNVFRTVIVIMHALR